MFREVARKKQALTKDECIDILKTAKRGVLSVIGDDGYPYGTPLNHWYCEEDGMLYFHGGKAGHRVDAMRACCKASFVCTDGGTPAEDGWWLRFRSVVVFGRIAIVEDHDRAMDITRRLCRKFTQDENYIEDEIRGYGGGTLVYALRPEHITGKTVNER